MNSALVPQDQSNGPVKNRIVLLGIGHTNAHVLAEWKKSPIPNSELICISKFSTAMYSGMLPAVLAQQQRSESMQIDLVALCSSANAKLVLGNVNGIDRDKKEILFSDRLPLQFNVLSIGIGSIPALHDIEVNSPHAISIKPMQTFLPRLGALVQSRLKRSDSMLEIGVIGGGAAGVEISCCLNSYLKQIGVTHFQIHLLSRSDTILRGSSDSTRKRVHRKLARLGIVVSCASHVIGIHDDQILLKDGQQIVADIVIVATGAAAPPLLEHLELPLSDTGFLLTDDSLKTVAGDSIFAVGDTGTIQSHSVPKAGVFAVREGPILWDNIQRELTEKPLKRFKPQKIFLRIINTGDGSAVAELGQWSIEGTWVLALKNLIDRRFIQKYKVQKK